VTVLSPDGFYVLGFTGDAVVDGWQDARLAYACVQAWRAAGRPEDFSILQAPGDGPYLVHWFVSPQAARVLDDHGVPWRGFLTGQRRRPPTAAHVVLLDPSPPA